MSPKNSPPPTIEYILLGLLYQNPQHGYSLHQDLQSRASLSRIWHVKRSKLYYLLEKLERKGLITGTHVPEKKRPSRDVYHLTEQGEQAFLDWVEAPIEVARHVRLVILARLYFALSLGREVALNLLARQREQCAQWLDSLLAERERLSQPDLITEQVFAFRIGQIQAMSTWIENCREQILSTETIKPDDLPSGDDIQ